MMKPSSRKDFTMIEMVVVVLLIALLAAIATPMYFSYLKDARVTAAQTQIDLLDQAVMDYSVRMGTIPPPESGLTLLVQNPNNDSRWRPFLRGNTVPKDPWGNDYVYRVLGNGDFEILSYGEDGREGGDGYAADLSNKSDRK